MAANLEFWVPVRHLGQTTWGQKMGAYADSYFYLGGRAAVVLSGRIEEGSIGVQVHEEALPQWKTALKIASYFTLILPALMFVVKVASRISHQYHVCEQVLSDGTREVGVFLGRQFYTGTRIKGEHMTFLRPRFVREGKETSREFGFAEVTIEGRPEIIPVQRSISVVSSDYRRP